MFFCDPIAELQARIDSHFDNSAEMLDDIKLQQEHMDYMILEDQVSNGGAALEQWKMSVDYHPGKDVVNKLSIEALKSLKDTTATECIGHGMNDWFQLADGWYKIDEDHHLRVATKNNYEGSS